MKDAPKTNKTEALAEEKKNGKNITERQSRRRCEKRRVREKQLRRFNKTSVRVMGLETAGTHISFAIGDDRAKREAISTRVRGKDRR